VFQELITVVKLAFIDLFFYSFLNPFKSNITLNESESQSRSHFALKIIITRSIYNKLFVIISRQNYYLKDDIKECGFQRKSLTSKLIESEYHFAK